MITKQKLKRQTNKPKGVKATRGEKKIDWDKYVGKIHFSEDGVTFQRRIRDEWAK
ncbi:MAG: hypothetical protein K2U26_15790 [Cyclobacteriaceae bacterium]|nr:hypothetical protein [Cyclobacteriaceae bacterium]